MPVSVPGLLLTHSGDVKSIKITIQADAQGCQLSDIQKYLKKKTAPTLLGTYPWKNQTLHLIGYKEGKAGTENQHELPPPHDKELFFGDIVLLLSKEKKSFAKPTLMKTEEYESFYTQMFEGFESIGESDSEDEEEAFEEEEDAVEDDEEKEEGEFEENEEFSDDNDDQDTLEEFDGHPKEEEEEPVQPILAKRPVKSRAKSKSAKDHQNQNTLVISELDPEEEVPTDPPTEKHRAAVMSVLESTMSELLSEEDMIELEHYLYNFSLQVSSRRHIPKSWSLPLFVEIYTSLARSVIGNFNPNSYIQNKTLYSRYQQGRITLEELASLSFSDLYPDIWKDLSIRQFEREKRQLEGNKSMATDQFECKRCHKRECTYYELQTRSADEPMTIFIQCVNCGKHWRQ